MKDIEARIKKLGAENIGGKQTLTEVKDARNNS